MTKKPGFCDNLGIEPKMLANKPGFCLSVKNNPLENLGISIGENREYKIFKVDAETGEVASMKIREL